MERELEENRKSNKRFIYGIMIAGVIITVIIIALM